MLLERPIHAAHSDSHTSATKHAIAMPRHSSPLGGALSSGSLERVSLALADARAPERWLLGVELDGAHWALAPTTLDRESVRGSVLAALGWSILPVATLDAWRDLPRVVESIDAAARRVRDAQPRA